MAKDNESIEIKVEVDTSDVKKSMKDVAKETDNMAKNIKKSGDKAEDSFDGLTKQFKIMDKQMKNMGKNINLSGFKNTMNNVKKLVSNTVKTVTKSFDNMFKGKKTMEIDAKVTTDVNSGVGLSDATALAGQAMTSGAIGSGIQKNLSQIGDDFEDTMDGVEQSIGNSMSEIGSDMKTTMADTTKAIEDSFTRTRENLKEMFANLNLGDSIKADMENAMDGVMKTIKASINLESLLGGKKLFDFSNPLKFIENRIDTLSVTINKFGKNSEKLGEAKKRLEDLNKIKVALTLDQPLAELDELFNKFNQAPTKKNASKIMQVFEDIQNQMQNVGLDTSGMDVLFEEWNDIQKAGTKVTNSLKTGMSDLRQQLGLLSTTTKQSITDTVALVKAEKDEVQASQQVEAQVSKQAKIHSKLQSAMKGVKGVISSVRDSFTQLKDKYKETEKAQESLTKSAKKTENVFKDMFKQLEPYLKVAAIFTTIKNSITSYTDSLQDNSKFGLMFGSEAQNMTDWLNELNATVTTSKDVLMDFSGNLFRMGTNMNMSTDDAISMSKQMTKLGADLVALTGDTNVIDALAGALRGEYDSLQNFGYIIDADAVKTRALKMGLDASTESAKALARQSILMEQSMHVLGYGAKQAQTLGGQLTMLRKNFEALGASIGSCFAGILQVVLPVLNSIVVAVTNAFNQIAKVLNAIFGVFGITVGTGGVSGSVGGAVGDAVGGIVDDLGSGLDSAGGGASDVADELDKASGSAKELKKYLAGVDELNLTPEKSQPSGGSGSGSSGSGGSGGAGTGAGVGGTIDDILGSAQEGSSVIEDIFADLEDWMVDLVNGFVAMFNMFKAGWQSVADYINTSIANLKQAFSNLGSSIKEFLIGAWNNGGAELIFNFGRLSGAITGAIIDIAGQCVQMVADLFTHLNPETNPYTQAFIKGLNNLLIACQNFALSVGGWFKTFVDNGGQAFLNVMGDIVMILGTTLANTLATTINWITRFMNSWAGQTLIKGVAIALDIVAGALKLVLIVVEKLTPLWSALLLKFAVVSVFTKITKALKLLKSALVLVAGKLAGGLGITSVIVKFKALANAVKLAYLQLKGGVVLSQVIQKFGLLPGLIAGIINAFKTWALAVKGATVAQTAYNIALSIGAGAMQLLCSPVTLIIGAIVALVAIVDVICQKFFNWEGIISWLGEKLGWLWDKIKSFFGWEGDNNIDDEIDLTSDSLDGLGYTMEQTSERFGTSCSAMNEALASIHVDSNSLAISLDEAEKTFNEKFSRMSASGQEYLDALVTGNQEVLDEMAGDSEKYLEEIAYVWDNLSQQEKAVMYATYGEINGITDGWCDYTKGSYEDALFAHVAYLESVENNEKLSAQEKDKLTEEATEKFKQTYQDRLDAVNKTIEEIESAEGASEEQKYLMLQSAYEERDKLMAQHEEYQKGTIKTTDDLVQASAQTQKDAYNGVADEQEKALENVSAALEDTKTDLQGFKEESDKVAKEIPEAWAGIGETISEEFDEASNEVVKSLNTMNTKVKGQSNTLKATLKSAFATINDGTKKSMTTMTNNIKQAFDKMSKNIKTQMQQIATELQARFTQINNGLNKSFTTMSTQVLTVLKNMANQISNSLRGVETTFKTSMNNISNVAKTKIQEACKTITTKVEAMKQPITNSFNGIKTNVGNSLDALNKTVTNKMQVVLNTVKRFVNQLQNATNFTFKTPYMRMPHINVHGDWNFEKKTTPSFSVRWYSDGGIFNKRSLIGVGDKYHGIGNNPEMVMPLDSFWKELSNQFDKQTKVLSNNNGNESTTVVLNMDGREVGRGVVNNLKEMSRLGQVDMSWL